MTCSNCNERPGAPATVVFPREDKRVSLSLCEACRTAIEAAPRCAVRENATPRTDGE